MAILIERRIESRRIKLGLAGAIGISAMGGGAVSAAEPQLQPIVSEGAMPSLSHVVFDARTEAVWVNPVRIESPQQAADLFGGNPNRWEINEHGGAHYLGRGDGKTTRLRTNGAVVEAWIGIKRNGENQAQTLVANPEDVRKVDIAQGTFWLAPEGKERALWRQVRIAVIDRESKPPEQGGQPDVAILPLCIPPGPETHRSVTPRTITRREAADYGLDKYARNKAHWRRAENGWTLVPDPSGLHHRVKAREGVWRAWVAIDRPNGIDALSIVATQARRMDIRGGTLYIPEAGDQKALFHQVLRQVRRSERQTQPGVLVIPVCN